MCRTTCTGFCRKSKLSQVWRIFRMRPHTSHTHSPGRTRWRVAKALAFSETTKPPAKTLVTIPYQALKDSRANLAQELERAYGDSGLGILTVSGIGTSLTSKRQRLLRQTSRLVSLPKPALSSLEDPVSSYNVGWSCGRETLQNGRPDTHKGSFYANPLTDNPAPGDSQLAAAYPQYFRPNRWPGGELPDLEPAFKELGLLMYETGLLLAAHCAKYASQSYPHLQPQLLVDVLRQSRNHKARLLHYFPQPCNKSSSAAASEPPTSSSVDHDMPWCGWHTDHGSLTGLTSAMYMCDGGEVPCPDPEAGLYVRTREGEVVRVVIPPDHIAFQVGEALQIHSGGALRATPHYVRAPRPGPTEVSRSTFALFLQPDVACMMTAPEGASQSKVAVGAWQPGQTFGGFSAATFQEYY